MTILLRRCAFQRKILLAISIPSFEAIVLLRKQLLVFYEKHYGVDLDAEREICVMGGAKIGLVELPLALMNPGDLLLLPDPGYPDYLSGVSLGRVTYEPSL